MLPNFLIVGSAKAGTTSLYYYLQQHPEISFPELKEPKYFSSLNLQFPHKGTGDSTVDKFAIKSFEEYKKLFNNLNTKRIGEASPDYLYYYEKTPDEIYQKLGDIPIIIILRSPIKRAFSAYSYLTRDSRETLTFKEALEKEEYRQNNNYDFIWSYKRGGLYYEQVRAYKNRFTNVKVLLLEEFSKDPEKEMASIFEFLQVDTSFRVSTEVTHNVSGKPSNFIARFLLSRDNNVSQILRELLKKYVRREWLEKISSKFMIKEKILDTDANFLKDYYQEDIHKLEKLLDKDLSIWKF